MGCRQAVRHGTLTPAFVGSNPAIPARKKHLLRQVLFSVKFVPAERVKYADACEIAYGSEMRFAREENEFHFTFCEAKYFTISARKLFHIRRKPNILLKAFDSEVFRNFVDAFRAFWVYRQIRTGEMHFLI